MEASTALAETGKIDKRKNPVNAERVKNYRWKPGQSGNPHGPHVGQKLKLAELRQDFLALVPKATEKLFELVASSNDNVALQAAQFVYLYAFGKPQEGRDLAHLEAMRARMTELVAVPVSYPEQAALPSTHPVEAQELPAAVLTTPAPPEAPDVETLPPPAPVSAPTGLRCIYRGKDGQCADAALPDKQWCGPHHAKLFAMVQL